MYYAIKRKNYIFSWVTSINPTIHSSPTVPSRVWACWSQTSTTIPCSVQHASTTPGTCLSPTVPSRDRARCSQSSSTLPCSVLHASTNPGIRFSPRRPTVFRLTGPSSGNQQRLDPWDMRPSVSGPSSGSHHPATSPPTQGTPDQHDQMRHRSPARPQEPNAIQTSSALTTAQH